MIVKEKRLIFYRHRAEKATLLRAKCVSGLGGFLPRGVLIEK
jgi:hypothetical protein